MSQHRDMNLVVAHYVPVWLPQTQTWIHTQVSSLPAEVENHVICLRTKHLDQFPQPNLHTVSDGSIYTKVWNHLLMRSRLQRFPVNLLDVSRRFDVKVLHSHFGHSGWYNLHAAQKGGLRHTVTFYGFDLSHLPHQYPHWRNRYRELFDTVDLVFCEGRHMVQKAIDLGCPPEKARVHHLGIHPSRIQFQPRTWHPGDPLRVLLAASFKEKKGLPYALEALAILKEEIALEITIIGDATDDPQSQNEKQRILETIKRNNLASCTRLLGFQSHARMYAEAYQHHVFLSPSVTASNGDTEGGAPVSLIEMAASGMLIVSSRHCDIPEIVKDGTTGLLADERDVSGLVGCLNTLTQDPEQWLPMQKAARSHIEAEYNASIQGERLASYYRSIV